MAAPEEKTGANTHWCDFVKAMTVYYKPAENITLKHFHFWSNMQKDGETLVVFCNRVLVEARHCSFNYKSVDCTAQDTAVRYQIIISLKDNGIHQEALKRFWDLERLRREGMKMESSR